jgi:hypothetical protein
MGGPHGESKTEGKGRQAKSQKNKKEGRRQIRRACQNT